MPSALSQIEVVTVFTVVVFSEWTLMTKTEKDLANFQGETTESIPVLSEMFYN